jgi:hypothetical protein
LLYTPIDFRHSATTHCDLLARTRHQKSRFLFHYRIFATL